MIPLAAALALATAPADAPPEGPPPPTFDEAGLVWKKAPSIDAMRRFYPRRARREGVFRAVAEVVCTARASGRLDCKAVSEAPGDLTFGKSAVLVMNQTRVAAADGGSPEGRTFGYRLRFGIWPPGLLPASFQPKPGLRWKIFPNMIRWKMSGLKPNEVWTANYACTARADGFITCILKDAAPADVTFLKAAEAALATSRVERTDGGPVDGETFDWRVSVMRQGWCSAGREYVPGGGIEPTQCGDARMVQVR
jgi:hypothetical protein